MTAHRPDALVIGGAVVLVVVVIAVVALLLGASSTPPAPVSNPGAGIDAPRTTPPPRFDWTDDE